MRILQFSTLDRGGGAGRVAYDLHRAYQECGHDARMLVRRKFTADKNIMEIDPYAYTSAWGPVCARLEKKIRAFPKFSGQDRLVEWLRIAAWPRRWRDEWRGLEDFNYPYATHLLKENNWRPDLIHAHNLHGKYFDLRALAHLSRQIPVVWTLHDAWALTGHCSHFAHLGCERWRSGCGNCPDLGCHLAIRRDRSADNWERKRRIYAASRLAVATPSRWLMSYVEQSMLTPWGNRVIPNGVDLTIFKPGDRWEVRQQLKLPSEAVICMFIAPSGSNPHPYKDYIMVERAVSRVFKKVPDTNLVFVCIGDNKIFSDNGRSYYTGRLDDPKQVSLYYQATDILLHGANVDTSPLTVIEALACGTPVIASAVGGISELIIEGENGYLVPRGDSELMARRIDELLGKPDLLQRLRRNALEQRNRFSLDHQVDAYLEWFEELRDLHYMDNNSQKNL